jgi:hypothetical protein
MKREMMKKALLTLLCLGVVQIGNAEIIKVNGEGLHLLLKDLNSTRNQAFNNAKKDAVITLIKRINGPQAMNEANQYLDDIVKQIDSSYVLNRGSNTNSNNELVTQVSLEMDDQEFRSILNDLGLAKKSSRTSPIMIVMDEYFKYQR